MSYWVYLRIITLACAILTAGCNIATSSQSIITGRPVEHSFADNVRCYTYDKSVACVQVVGVSREER